MLVKKLINWDINMKTLMNLPYEMLFGEYVYLSGRNIVGEIEDINIKDGKLVIITDICENVLDENIVFHDGLTLKEKVKQIKAFSKSNKLYDIQESEIEPGDILTYVMRQANLDEKEIVKVKFKNITEFEVSLIKDYFYQNDIENYSIEYTKTTKYGQCEDETKCIVTIKLIEYI